MGAVELEKTVKKYFDHMHDPDKDVAKTLETIRNDIFSELKDICSDKTKLDKFVAEVKKQSGEMYLPAIDITRDPKTNEVKSLEFHPDLRDKKANATWKDGVGTALGDAVFGTGNRLTVEFNRDKSQSVSVTIKDTDNHSHTYKLEQNLAHGKHTDKKKT